METLEIIQNITIVIFMVGNLLEVGLRLKVDEAVAALRNIRFVVISLLWCFVLGPALAVLLTKLIPLTAPYALGLVLLGMAPCSPAIPVMMRRSGGSLAYMSAFMLVAYAGTVLLMPFMVPLLATGFTADPWTIAKPLLFFIAVPLVIGVVIRRLAEAFAEKAAPIVKTITSVNTVILCLVLLWVYRADIFSAVGTYAIGSQILLYALLGAGAYLLSFGLSYDQKAPMTLGICTRNVGPALATLLGVAAAPQGAITMCILAIFLGAILSGFVAAAVLKRFGAPSPVVATLLLCLTVAFSLSCGSPVREIDLTNDTQIASEPQPEPSAEPVEETDPALLDKVRNEQWTGDIDGMLERRYIRAIVIYNKTNFFYDGPRTRGIAHDALTEFEKFLNKKLETGNERIHIIFIPVTREEAVKRMQEGRGDIAVGNIPIVPELEKIVDFSDPVRDRAQQLVVAGPSAEQVNSIDELGGTEIYVRKFSRYWLTLERLNENFRREGKPTVNLREADPALEDEDIINMVAAGQVPMTVTDDLTAGLWGKVFPELKIYDQIPLVTDDRMGWAVQHRSKNFLALVNEFVKDHKVGTAFGNSVLASYLQTTKWAKNNVSPQELEKYKAAVVFFKKYGADRGFDWRLIAAQAYQESQIDQSVVSPAGAVGVMQIKPSTAAGDPINIQNVDRDIENNIHAGTKYLDYISKKYFADSKMTPTDRALFAFASYNAGPARIAGLREKAKRQGLDPDKWFGNVELIAAREIGTETVTYVSNIYKYYVGYKIANETASKRKKSLK